MGVLKEKGVTFGPDSDCFVLVPLKAFQRKISGNSDIGFIYLSVEDGYSSEAVKEEVRHILRERSEISLTEEDNFGIRDLKELVKILSAATKTLTRSLGAIAGLSLVVGRIGIMNIMLVSVTDGTREIGLGLAVGVRQRDVLLQFLTEAVLISFLGGVLGVLLALFASYCLCMAMFLPFVLRPWVLAFGFGFSVAAGVLFALYLPTGHQGLTRLKS